MDFVVISEHVFNTIFLGNSNKKLYVQDKSERFPSRTPDPRSIASIPTTTSKIDFWKRFNCSKKMRPKPSPRKPSQNDGYSMDVAHLKVVDFFRHSIFHVLQLRYRKWSFIRKNISICVCLVFFDREKFKLALDLLLELRIKVKSATKAQLKLLGLFRRGPKNSAFWSTRAEQDRGISDFTVQNGRFILNYTKKECCIANGQKI